MIYLFENFHKKKRRQKQRTNVSYYYYNMHEFKRFPGSMRLNYYNGYCSDKNQNL